ncbi:MAG: porin [Alphaproteobacteria bacterium]|nr:porin [Alphaproteobacteria bacterium]
MTKTSKITAFAAPAIMALAVAAPSEAKILLMGDGGWEVSFDGSVNSFYNFVTTEELTTTDVATNATHTGQDADGEDTSRITVGLLPAVWGMNVKAPTTNGLDMSARIGLYPSTQNNRRKNTSQASTGGQNGGNLDLREIFFAVDGSFGQVLVGRTLGLYQGKNILTDMTLFGVGAGAASGGGTTLGRIGWGYVYPNFNAGIRYTTPDFNGVKAQVGIFDPSTLGGGGGVTETSMPRLEAEVSYAGNMSGVSVSAWANGMFQTAQRSNSEIQTLCGLAINGGTSGGADTNTIACGVDSSIDVGGGAFGLQLGYGGLTLTGSGYIGSGLGTTLMLDTDAIDAKGHARGHNGYIAQGTYAFGQGTSIGASYGESRAKESSTDLLQRASTTVAIESQGLLDFMVWHDINKNLRVVAEYGLQEREWHDGVSQDSTNVSVGGFFFW